MEKQLFQTELDETVTTDKDIVGTKRTDNLGNSYRFVKNVDTTAMVVGQPVCWDSAANAGSRAAYLGDVTLAVTAELANSAGLCMGALAISGGACYGWIMVDGYFTDGKVRTPKTVAVAEGSQMHVENTKAALGYIGVATAADTYYNTFHALQVLATDSTGTAVTSIDIQVSCL